MTITIAKRTATNGLAGYDLETGNRSGLTLVTDPAGESGEVLRSYLHGDDALSGGSHRSELSVPAVTAPIGAVAWYWFETYIPSDWVAGGNEAIYWQVHDTPDGGDAVRVPPLAMTIVDDLVRLDSAAATSAGDDTQVKRIGIWSEALHKHVGRWVSWVVMATWNYTSSGALKVWRDRRLVFVETGQKNCFNDVAGLYPKLGVYVPSGLDSEIPSRTIYHRGLVVGDNAYSTFDGFMAAAGSSDRERETLAAASVGA